MRIFLLVVLILCVSLIFLSSRTVQDALSSERVYTIDLGVEPEVSARAWGVFDAATGNVLLAQNEREVLPVASLTKLFTADIALDTLALEASTTLSWRAVATEGRAGSLRAGEHMSVRELLFPLLIESSNDAAEALAEHSGRARFIEDMNAQADALGMDDTYFADPSGLSPQNVSTVHDLAIFIAHLSNNQPYVLDITSLPTYIGSTHAWWNVNPLVNADTFRGGKHGYTDEANRTFAGIFNENFPSGTSAEISIILLGSDDLPRDIEAIRSFMRDHVNYR